METTNEKKKICHEWKWKAFLESFEILRWKDAQRKWAQESEREGESVWENRRHRTKTISK